MVGDLMDFFKNLIDIGLCFVLPYIFCFAPFFKKTLFKDIQVHKLIRSINM